MLGWDRFVLFCFFKSTHNKKGMLRFSYLTNSSVVVYVILFPVLCFNWMYSLRPSTPISQRPLESSFVPLTLHVPGNTVRISKSNRRPRVIRNSVKWILKLFLLEACLAWSVWKVGFSAAHFHEIQKYNYKKKKKKW